MESVFDFLRAALPLIAVGLALAVLFARSAGKEKKKEQTGDYSTEGMCLGMCLGTAIGASFGNNTGMGSLPRYADRSGNRQLYQKGESRSRQ